MVDMFVGVPGLGSTPIAHPFIKTKPHSRVNGAEGKER